MAPEERRRDVGLKFMYVILTAIITFLMSGIFFKTFEKAEAAIVLGNENKTKIAVLESCVNSVHGQLGDMNEKLDMLLGWKK